MKQSGILTVSLLVLLIISSTRTVRADSTSVLNWLKPIQIRANYQHLEGSGFFPKQYFTEKVSQRDLMAVEVSYNKPLLKLLSLNMFSKTAAQTTFSIGRSGRQFDRRSENGFTTSKQLMLVSYIFPNIYVRGISELQESSALIGTNATVIENDGRQVSFSNYTSMNAVFSRFEVGFKEDIANEDYHTVDAAYLQTSIVKPLILPGAESIIYLANIDQKGFLFRYYFGPE